MRFKLAILEALKKVVDMSISAGFQLDKEAFEFLKNLEEGQDPVLLMSEVLKKIEEEKIETFLITRELLERASREVLPKKTVYKSSKSRFKPYAKEIEADINVLSDPTNFLNPSGTMEGYLTYFKDRFLKLSKFLKMRIDCKDAIPINEANKAKEKTKVKIIGMVTEKKERKGIISLKIEDLDSEANILITQKAKNKLIEKARNILLDQVICIIATKTGNDLFFAEEVIFPEIPSKINRKLSPEPVNVVLTSDLHVGSKTFMEKEFQRFIYWIRGEYGNRRLRKLASHTKYLVILGDLIDGIGVYPNQIEELLTKDIQEQYQQVAKFIEQIPDYVEVIIIPGNHDAVRRALPQPAIPRDYVEPIYEKRKIYSLGEPSTIKLHGVELLLYHGRSIDDVIANIPDITFHTPDLAMKVLLQSRHLAPIYGQRTLLAPEEKDYLIIESPPDIFAAGHIHVWRYNSYKGTLIVNTGAWQRQTEYQRMMGLMPTPGVVPVVNLQNLEVTPISFV